jgi:hypothetical protein
VSLGLGWGYLPSGPEATGDLNSTATGNTVPIQSGTTLAINDAGLLRRLLALVKTTRTSAVAHMATTDNQDNRAISNGTPTRTGAFFAGRQFAGLCRRLQHRASNKVVPAGRGRDV